MIKKNKKINIDLKVDIKNIFDNSEIIFKNYRMFIKEEFLNISKKKSHNLENHIKNFKEKIVINQLEENSRDFRKYNIHYINFGINIGNEINGIRPALIIKSNRHNKGYDIIIIPMTGLYDLTGKEKKLDKFDIIIKPDKNNRLKKDSILKIRHIKSISKKRIGDKIGELKNTLDNDKMYDLIDFKIKQMIGIK